MKLVPFPKKYSKMMPPPAVKRILKKNPSLVWWVKDKDSLNLRSATEAILNFGDWDEFKILVKSSGMKTIKRMVESETKMPRCNYRPEVIGFFRDYFRRHAS